ncbi:hypothetical protein K438DRAFT_1771401 [Mycena galopus ATCC 62051]|nr:hypothetical protein K438DRAFT_1771401 [Mycena galopus ATCC 62051]
MQGLEINGEHEGEVYFAIRWGSSVLGKSVMRHKACCTIGTHCIARINLGRKTGHHLNEKMETKMEIPFGIRMATDPILRHYQVATQCDSRGPNAHERSIPMTPLLGPPPVTVTATAVESTAVFLAFNPLMGRDGRDGRKNISAANQWISTFVSLIQYSLTILTLTDPSIRQTVQTLGVELRQSFADFAEYHNRTNSFSDFALKKCSRAFKRTPVQTAVTAVVQRAVGTGKTLPTGRARHPFDGCRRTVATVTGGGPNLSSATALKHLLDPSRSALTLPLCTGFMTWDFMEISGLEVANVKRMSCGRN